MTEENILLREQVRKMPYIEDEKKRKLLEIHNQILINLSKYTTRINENTYQLDPLPEGKKYTFSADITRYEPRKAETITVHPEDEHILVTIQAEPTNTIRVNNSFNIFIINDYDDLCDEIAEILIENGTVEEETDVTIRDGFCQVWYQRGYYLSKKTEGKIMKVLPFEVKGIMCSDWWTRFSDIEETMPGTAEDLMKGGYH